jgi:hypothetical protein
MAIPTAALQPALRLLFMAVEAFFANVFWAMRTPKGGDYGMAQICPWSLDMLDWDGLCSHYALSEDVVGDFDLSPEELETKAAEIKQRNLENQKVVPKN